MHKRIQTLDGQTFDVILEHQWHPDNGRLMVLEEISKLFPTPKWTMHHLNAEDPPPMRVSPRLRNGQIVLWAGDDRRVFPISAETFLALLLPEQESKKAYSCDEMAMVYMKLLTLLWDAREEIAMLEQAERYDDD